jgi:hypothetical protein
LGSADGLRFVDAGWKRLTLMAGLVGASWWYLLAEAKARACGCARVAFRAGEARARELWWLREACFRRNVQGALRWRIPGAALLAADAMASCKR